jgi:hypothetical protein
MLENSPCFYRVTETRVFRAFDQSAPVFLKGYFIIGDINCDFTKSPPEAHTIRFQSKKYII